MRLSAEELAAYEKEEFKRDEKKVDNLRESIHQFLLVEARNQKATPSHIALAMVEEAALCTVAAAEISRNPLQVIFGLLAHFGILIGKGSRIREVEIAAKALLSKIRGVS